MSTEKTNYKNKRTLCHILIADDRPERRINTSLVLSEELSQCGIPNEIVTRRNGQEVYKDIMQLGNIYDILILDYGMPKLDGVSLVKKLRENGYQGHIVMLTGHWAGCVSANVNGTYLTIGKEKGNTWVDGIFDIFDGGDRLKLVNLVKKICSEKNCKV